jgi:hypothetical protein
VVGLSAYFLGKQGGKDAMFLPEILIFENLATMQHFKQ